MNFREQFPWKDIPVAKKGRLSRQRIEAKCCCRVFWFRDEQGKPGLLVEVSTGIPLSCIRKLDFDIRDISIDLFDEPEENIRVLLVRLEDQGNEGVFYKLCSDLVEHLSACNSIEETYDVTCLRLAEWQKLFSGKRRELLTQGEIRGLFAELCLIDEELERNPGAENVLIKGWSGPDRVQQDFILGDTALEIKSITGAHRRKVRISSEDQLQSHLGRLLLRIYFLAETEIHDRATSLNALVDSIKRKLQSAANRELFLHKLAETGYTGVAYYDAPLFLVKGQCTYHVKEDFPRLTAGTLPDGVMSVSYDIALAGLSRFETDEHITG